MSPSLTSSIEGKDCVNDRKWLVSGTGRCLKRERETPEGVTGERIMVGKSHNRSLQKRAERMGLSVLKPWGLLQRDRDGMRRFFGSDFVSPC